MHSFPQFSRSTLSGEFARVGAIIFGKNFMVRGQISSGQFTSGVIVRWTISLRGNGRLSHCPGGNYPGGGQSSRGQWEQFSSGAIVIEPINLFM